MNSGSRTKIGKDDISMTGRAVTLLAVLIVLVTLIGCSSTAQLATVTVTPSTAIIPNEGGTRPVHGDRHVLERQDREAIPAGPGTGPGNLVLQRSKCRHD